MKNILISLLVIIPCISGATGSNTGFGFAAGYGFRSDKGTVGAGIDIPLYSTGMISLEYGLDLAGPVSTLMFKQRISVKSSGSEWYTKCWFLFSCGKEIYLGVGGKYFDSYTQTFRKGEVTEAKYDVEAKTGVGATFTFRDQYSSGIFTDLDFSNRWRIGDPKFKSTSGPVTDSDVHDVTANDDGIGISFSLGYRF